MKSLLIVAALTVHGWYDYECCADLDCHPVECERIVSVAGGYDFEGIHFTNGQMKPSQDSRCHVCIHGTLKIPRCIYLPVRVQNQSQHLVVLTLPDNRQIYLNPAEVVSVRPRNPTEDFMHASVKCVIHTSDGKFVSVIEDCATVRGLFEQENEE